MYYDHGKEPATYLRIAKHLAVHASKCAFGSSAHLDFMRASLDYTRDRAILRMEKADR